MIIDEPNTGETIRRTPGRLEREDVLYQMRQEYQTITGDTEMSTSQMKTLKDMINQWYFTRIVARGPQSKLRKEYQVSPLTVRNYRCFINAVIVAGGRT